MPKPYDNPYPQHVGPGFENKTGEPLTRCSGCHDIWYDLDTSVVRDKDTNALRCVCFGCWWLHKIGVPFFPGRII